VRADADDVPGVVDVPGVDDLAGSVVGFARTLRAAGVDASPDRVHAFLDALDELGAASTTEVYWAGRLTLCADPDDLDRYDRVFAAFFDGVTVSGRGLVRREVRVGADAVGAAAGGEADEDAPTVTTVTRQASARELLRHRDVTLLDARERAELHRLLAACSLPPETRRSRRRVPAARGAVDRRRTVRRMLQAGGEPGPLRRAAHRPTPRRVVLLVDVSGSMGGYAEALLRFAHAATRGRVATTEVFTLGTRLTRITEELTHRDPDTAMRAVSAAIPDWSGGTRLADTLREFLDRWGQRGLARGAVAVVLSDGWETGDATALGEQMARLARLAHRVIWANPRAGRAGFEPTAAGMAAALPSCDQLVEGHSLAALEHLAAVVASAARAPDPRQLASEPRGQELARGRTVSAPSPGGSRGPLGAEGADRA
jgi:uncharacterized protein